MLKEFYSHKSDNSRTSLRINPDFIVKAEINYSFGNAMLTITLSTGQTESTDFPSFEPAEKFLKELYEQPSVYMEVSGSDPFKELSKVPTNIVIQKLSNLNMK